MNRKLWVLLHHVSNSWVFLVLNESSVKVNMKAVQAMRCIMCHSYNNSISFHSSTKSQKHFFYLTTLCMLKHFHEETCCHEHGSELLKCMVHKNALGNNNGKQQKPSIGHL